MAIPFLRKTKGRLVNVGSVVGRYAPSGVSVYAATKFAVEGFSDSLRKELSIWGIKVIIIEPGVMKTNLYTEANNDAAFENIYKQLPEDVKNVYGKEYFVEYRKNLNSGVNKLAGDPEIIVEGMFRAVTDQFPKKRYTLGKDKFYWLSLSYLPSIIGDNHLKLLKGTRTPPKALQNN